MSYAAPLPGVAEFEPVTTPPKTNETFDMANFGDLHQFPVRGLPTLANAANILAVAGTVTFGTSGAVASYATPNGVTVTKPSGTGVYEIAIPGAQRVIVQGLTYEDAAGSGVLDVTLKSVAANLVTVVTVAEGTGTTAPADAVSGDKVHFALWVEF